MVAAASKHGLLADMEELQRLLGNTLKQYTILRETLQEVRANNDVRAERNIRLRNRLENMKGEIGSQMNAMFARSTHLILFSESVRIMCHKIFALVNADACCCLVMNINSEDVLIEGEIKEHSTEAFNKFESSGDGRLGPWDFMQAWTPLGLKGSEISKPPMINEEATGREH